MILSQCKVGDRIWIYLDPTTTDMSPIKTTMRTTATVMGYNACNDACIGWGPQDGIRPRNAFSMTAFAAARQAFPTLTFYAWVIDSFECEPYTSGTQARNTATTTKPAEAPCKTCGRMNFVDASQYMRNIKKCYLCGEIPH